MDIQPNSQSNQSISDDQELAKVLAGVDNQSDDSGTSDTDTPAVPTPPTPMPEPQAAPDQQPDDAQPAADALTMPEPETTAPEPAAAPSSGSPELDAIKQEALGELRPLVDKLNVSAEEKFDTYLLLLRSTDDRELIAPAHDAAKAIDDEARRAQALLDIIKEIDFLSQNQK